MVTSANKVGGHKKGPKYVGVIQVWFIKYIRECKGKMNSKLQQIKIQPYNAESALLYHLTWTEVCLLGRLAARAVIIISSILLKYPTLGCFFCNFMGKKIQNSNFFTSCLPNCKRILKCLHPFFGLNFSFLIIERDYFSGSSGSFMVSFKYQ